MEKKHFDIETFYEKTNGGLLFFEQEFVSEKIKKTSKGFSFDGGSSNVTKDKNGKYLFTNFKESNKGIDAVSYFMNKNGCDFITALQNLYAQFQIEGTTTKPLHLPLKKWTDTTAKKIGEYEIKFAKKVVNQSFFAPFLNQETAKDYNFYEIEKFETVRQISGTEKLSVLSVESTPDYPIFGYKDKDFTKIYEPKAIKNKDGFSSKHHFLGTKPARHIYGYDRLQKLAAVKPKENNGFSIIDISTLAVQEEEELLDFVFIATGGSDGLNLASLGYDVIWFNSETEIISEYELNFLFSVAKNVVYVPDLDKTGIKQAFTMGMLSKKHLKIKMLFPPQDLLQRGKKDIADWIKEQKNESLSTVKFRFSEILDQAKQFEFWDYNPKRAVFQVNNMRLINFLHHHGFYIYEIPQMDKKSKRAISEKIFLRIENNKIEKPSLPM